MKRERFLFILILLITSSLFFVNKISFAAPRLYECEGYCGPRNTPPPFTLDQTTQCQTGCGPGTINTCATHSVEIVRRLYYNGQLRPCAFYEIEYSFQRVACEFIPDRQCYVLRGQETNYICSTADKLVDSRGFRLNGYLASGQLNLSLPPGSQCVAGGFYKVCCGPDGKVVDSVEYRLSDTYDGIPPPEGWCGGNTPRPLRTGGTNIPVGQQHPDCLQIQPSITCQVTTTTSGNVQVTASSTSITNNEYIRIRLDSQSQSCNPGISPCTVTFSSLVGQITARAELLNQDDIVVASTTCSINVSAPLPFIPSPSAPQVPAGLCTVDVYARIKNPNQWYPINGDKTASSTYSGFYKDSQIEIDAGTKQIGNDVKVADCYYRECTQVSTRHECKWNRWSYDPTVGCYLGETGWLGCETGACYNDSKCGNGLCPGVADDRYVDYCSSWRSNLTSEEINNPSDCDTSKPINFEFNLGGDNVIKQDPNGNLFSVTYRPSTINLRKSFGFPSGWSLPRWLSELNNHFIISNPSRHGFYNWVVTASGTVYNLPNEKIISDIKEIAREASDPVAPASAFKDYAYCTFTNGQTVGESNDSNFANNYKVFSEKDGTNMPSNIPLSLMNGTEPIRINATAIAKFYINPTDVAPITPSIGNSENVIHPTTSIRTATRTHIVGYPFNVTFSVYKSRYFGYDSGRFWLTVNNSEVASVDINESGGYQTGYYRDRAYRAGTYYFCTQHDADDEVYSYYQNGDAKGNIETSEFCPSVTIYRYLCYQGFCYECPREPDGVPPNLRGSGCNIVEPVKCQAYIGSDCRGKGRE